MSPKQISREKFLCNVALQKKLLTYSAVASLTVAAGMALAPAPAGAAGVVIDVNPDQTVSNGEFDLDFDQDGFNEFKLMETSPGSEVIVWGLGTAASDQGLSVIGYTATLGSVFTFVHASALNQGDPVSAGANWYAVTPGATPASTATLGYYVSAGWQGGAWPGQGVKYLGLKFMLDGVGPYYGWAEISVAPDSSSFVISRYGYDDAGSSIPAVVKLSRSQAASPVSLQALVAGVFAALGGALAWLRQRIVRRGRQV